MPFGARSVQIGPLREGIAAANRAPPPLAKACHCGVVHCHFRVEPPDAPARCTHADAQLRFFARDQVITEAANGSDRLRAHYRDSAACTHLSRRSIPLLVTEPAVDRL